jgi:hypothetical protein
MVARSAAPVVELPRETVTIEAFGGDVLVRGMDITEMLRFMAAKRRLATPLEGETEIAADERSVAQSVPFALSMVVLADDGLPLYTEAQWRTWGARHASVVLELFSVAMRLSGNDPGAEKKT